MTAYTFAERRTVLKTAGAMLLGGSLASGAAGATEGGRLPPMDGHGPVVDVVAEHDHAAGAHHLTLDATEVAPGWTTFRFDNRTEHVHFGYLGSVPQTAIDAANEEGADLLEFYVEHVTRPFQFLMDDINPDAEPDPADLSDRYSDLENGVIFPPWFPEVRPSGGPGFTSGRTTSATTVTLDPGEYIIECYVKSPNGEFHSYDGMINRLTVADTGRVGAAPRGTVDLSLSTAGIDAPDTVRAGEHTVAVRIEDQQYYSHLLGHDVHLIRFDDDTTAADVNGWMNWMGAGQLTSGENEPGTFVGGAQTILTDGLLAGDEPERAFIHVNLTPGEYAWVSEIPSPADSGFLQPFTVTAADRRGRGVPPAHAGTSGVWGRTLERADDDLSERAATSKMSPAVKTAFDELANVDDGRGV